MPRARNNDRMPSNEPFRYSAVRVKTSPTGWGARLLDDDGNDIWISPGRGWPAVNSADRLADLIAEATTTPMDTVRTAMRLP